MKRKIAIAVAPILVLFFGMFGYIAGEGYGFYDALLSTLKLLKVELDPLPPNPAIELARWIGIIFFFGLIYTAVFAIIERGIILKRISRTDAVAIHGDGIYSEELRKVLGKRSVNSDSRLSFRAPIQVVMFNTDEETLDFYQKHSDELKKAEEVHLCLEMGSHVTVEQDNVFILNISETKAISYWRDNYCTTPERIAFIGSGQLAEAVLYWGLLTNVYDVHSKIKYDLYGDFDEFICTHPNVIQMAKDYGNDTIEIMTDKWYSNIDNMAAYDRIVLCGNTKDNVVISSKLNDFGIKSNIHVFADSNNIDALINPKNCKTVGNISGEKMVALFLMDDIHKSGKLCHATYMLGAKKELSGEITKELLEEYITGAEFKYGFKYIDDKGEEQEVTGWSKSDSFARGSNYAVAIHDGQKKTLLSSCGLDIESVFLKSDDAMTCDAIQIRDRLQEIEHIRWCRYHFLNHWKYTDETIIKDGKVKQKDPDRKVHKYLVPYSELTESVKRIDGEFYKTLSLRG